MLLWTLCLSVVCGFGQNEKLTAEQYIQKYSGLAVEEMYRAKIPASITMAQAILESGAGNSELSRKSNNHFGIKCKGNWKGASVYHDDDTLQECFRAYDSVYQSYKDHSDFLLSQSRYGFLFSLEPHDYKGWSYGLKKAGYATNPKYPELLIDYIEKHQLYKLDAMQADTAFKIYVAREIKSMQRAEVDVNETPGIIAGSEDTYQKIAVEYDMRMWQIQKYNDLPDEAICHPGDTVYLKPKRNKSFADSYTVKEGDHMRGISQRYAVKLRKLYQRNLMEPGEEPVKGEIIYINQTRDSKPKVYLTEFSRDFDKPFDYNSIFKSDSTPAKPEPSYNNSLPVVDSSKFRMKKVSPSINKGSSTDTMVRISPTQYREYMKLKAQDSMSSIKIKKSSSSAINRTHKVLAHETLYGISRMYQTTVASIKQLNHLESEALEVGQVLQIPDDANEDLFSVPEFHVWKKTDRFYRVAEKYHLSRKDLLKWNPEVDTTALKPGTKIILHKPSNHVR